MHTEYTSIERLAKNGRASSFIGANWGREGSNAEFAVEPAQQTPTLIQQTIQMMLEGVSEPACLIGAEGTILAVNQAWKDVTSCEEYAGVQLGCNFLSVTRGLEGADKVATALAAGLAAVCSGRRKQFQHSYQDDGPLDRGYTKVQMVGIAHAGKRYVLLRSLDMTEAWQLKRQQRTLAARVAHARAYERRHIARELRQSTEHLLAGLELSFSELDHCADRAQMETTLAACSHAIDLVQREVRAVSLLCHPPSLADCGFVPALETLVAGFCQRLGIESRVEFRGATNGIPRETEATLYRVAQEALRNALHFSKRTAVHLRLNVSGGRIRLAVEDLGDVHSHHHKAINADLPSLREWIEDLGGHLALIELPHGTRTIASLPLG